MEKCNLTLNVKMWKAMRDYSQEGQHGIIITVQVEKC